ncbi:MAG: hypothetical protein AVDCRST_MAG66-416, partial [uncultured Pseudonocardia sp.]
ARLGERRPGGVGRRPSRGTRVGAWAMLGRTAGGNARLPLRSYRSERLLPERQRARVGRTAPTTGARRTHPDAPSDAPPATHRRPGAVRLLRSRGRPRCRDRVRRIACEPQGDDDV